MSPKFADRPLIAALVRLSIALSACITMPTVVAAQSQDASPVAAVQTVGSEFLFPPPPVGLGMSRLPAVAMRVQRVEIAPAEQRAEQPPPSKRVAPSERETAPAARGEEAPEQASEQPIDAADKPPLAEQVPDATVARTTELVDESLAPLAVQVERNRTDYALLSARIDAIDRQVERELAEKDVFRQGILATVSELASTSDDRDDRFFDEAGFRYRTRDGRYALVIRGEVQADSRVFTRADQDPVNNGFYLPRSRIYFNGWVTKPIEYQFSIQRGFNNLNVLNAYVRFDYSEQLRLTAGRFKTPFTYDFYTYKNWQLLSPERSLFNVNFALNRNVGLMASGRYCQDRLEYAVGIFDGPRNSFSDTNSAKDAIAFLNFKPWVGTNGENFNLGGSVAYGRQDNPLNPVVLRTSTNASMSGLDGDDPVNRANVPFLAFNDGVREFGAKPVGSSYLAVFWSADGTRGLGQRLQRLCRGRSRHGVPAARWLPCTSWIHAHRRNDSWPHRGPAGAAF